MTWVKISLLWTISVITFLGCIGQDPSRERLTEADLEEIKKNVLKTAPDLKYQVNANLEDKVTYLGMNVNQDTVIPGRPISLTHFWKVSEPVVGWKIFIHLNDSQKSRFINADHTPIDGKYPASLWQPGEIIRDSHQVTIPADWSFPTVVVYAGLWQGNKRMKITGPQDNDNRIIVASLPVKIAAASKPKQIEAMETKQPIKLDGKLSEKVWNQTTSSGPFVNTMTGNPIEPKTEVKVAWDKDNLYVAFISQDEDVWSSLTKRDQQLWTQEVVEIFIDANSDKKDYVELQVNPNGTIFDSYLPGHRQNQNDFNSQMKASVSIDGTLNKRDDVDKSWTAEIAIPWKDTIGRSAEKMTFPPKPGDVWRVNFFRMDLPKKKRQWASAWSAPKRGDFHALDRFGNLIFKTN
jgi:hypothetical protein